MSLYNLILQCLSVVCFFFSPKAFLSRKLCVASYTSRFGFTAFQYAYLTIKWFPSDCFEADKCAHAASLYVVISLFFHWRKRLNINKSANIWKTKKKLFSVTLKSLDKGKMQRHSFVSVNLSTFFETKTTLVYNGTESALYNRSQIHSWARFLHASAKTCIRPLRTSMELSSNAHMILCRAFNLIQFLRKLHYILEKNIIL